VTVVWLSVCVSLKIYNALKQKNSVALFFSVFSFADKNLRSSTSSVITQCKARAEGEVLNQKHSVLFKILPTFNSYLFFEESKARQSGC